MMEAATTHKYDLTFRHLKDASTQGQESYDTELLRMENDTEVEPAVFRSKDTSLTVDDARSIGRSWDKDGLRTTIIFILAGTSALYPWNAMLNVLYDIVKYVYHDNAAADTVIVTYQTFSVFLVTCFVARGGVRPFVLRNASFANAIFLFLVPLIPLYLPNYYGIILLHLLTIPLSICVGCVLSTGMALASIMEFNYGGYVAFGIGVSGMLSFGLWIISDRLVFIRVDKYSEEGRLALVNTLWTVFGVGSAVLLATGLGACWLLQKPWFNDKVDQYWEERTGNEEHPYTSLHLLDTRKLNFKWAAPTWRLFKKCWQQLFNVAFSLFVTLAVFPLVGPYSWKGTNSNDIQVGLFQFFDLIGRYIPNFGDSVRLSKPILFFLVLLRTAFIALYAFPMVFTNTVFNEFWLQAILSCVSALTNGYCITLATIYAPGCIDNEKDKGKVGAYVTVSMQVGVLLGAYASKLYKEVLVLAMAG